jgi:hypothetical protein
LTVFLPETFIINCTLFVTMLVLTLADVNTLLLALVIEAVREGGDSVAGLAFDAVMSSGCADIPFAITAGMSGCADIPFAITAGMCLLSLFPTSVGYYYIAVRNDNGRRTGKSFQVRPGMDLSIQYLLKKMAKKRSVTFADLRTMADEQRRSIVISDLEASLNIAKPNIHIVGGNNIPGATVARQLSNGSSNPVHERMTEEFIINANKLIDAGHDDAPCLKKVLYAMGISRGNNKFKPVVVLRHVITKTETETETETRIFWFVHVQTLSDAVGIELANNTKDGMIHGFPRGLTFVFEITGDMVPLNDEITHFDVIYRCMIGFLNKFENAKKTDKFGESIQSDELEFTKKYSGSLGLLSVVVIDGEYFVFLSAKNSSSRIHTEELKNAILKQYEKDWHKFENLLAHVVSEQLMLCFEVCSTNPEMGQHADLYRSIVAILTVVMKSDGDKSFATPFDKSEMLTLAKTFDLCHDNVYTVTGVDNVNKVIKVLAQYQDSMTNERFDAIMLELEKKGIVKINRGNFEHRTLSNCLEGIICWPRGKPMVKSKFPPYTVMTMCLRQILSWRNVKDAVTGDETLEPAYVLPGVPVNWDCVTGKGKTLRDDVNSYLKHWTTSEPGSDYLGALICYVVRHVSECLPEGTDIGGHNYLDYILVFVHEFERIAALSSEFLAIEISASKEILKPSSVKVFVIGSTSDESNDVFNRVKLAAYKKHMSVEFVPPTAQSLPITTTKCKEKGDRVFGHQILVFYPRTASTAMKKMLIGQLKKLLPHGIAVEWDSAITDAYIKETIEKAIKQYQTEVDLDEAKKREGEGEGPTAMYSDQDMQNGSAGNYFAFILKWLKVHPKGWIIIFCGLPGSGKTTLGRAIAVLLSSLKIEALVLGKCMGEEDHWNALLKNCKQIATRKVFIFSLVHSKDVSGQFEHQIALCKQRVKERQFHQSLYDGDGKKDSGEVITGMATKFKPVPLSVCETINDLILKPLHMNTLVEALIEEVLVTLLVRDNVTDEMIVNSRTVVAEMSKLDAPKTKPKTKPPPPIPGDVYTIWLVPMQLKGNIVKTMHGYQLVISPEQLSSYLCEWIEKLPELQKPPTFMTIGKQFHMTISYNKPEFHATINTLAISQTVTATFLVCQQNVAIALSVQPDDVTLREIMTKIDQTPHITLGYVEARKGGDGAAAAGRVVKNYIAGMDGGGGGGTA